MLFCSSVYNFREVITTNIEFSVINQRVIVPKEQSIIAESVGYVTFTCRFGSEWDDLVKHVVFTNGQVSRCVIIEPDAAQFIPHEVLKKGKLYASFIGLSPGGEMKLTTKKMLIPISVYEAGAQCGEDPEEYSPALWEQALSEIGDLSSLVTSSKTSLVSAINELAAGGTPTVAGKTVTGITCTTRTRAGNLYGDVNGDGTVSTTDLILIGRYIEDGTVSIDAEAADVNFDGAVDDDDLDILAALPASGIGTTYVLAKFVLTYSDGTSAAVLGRVPAGAADVNDGFVTENQVSALIEAYIEGLDADDVSY